MSYSIVLRKRGGSGCRQIVCHTEASLAHLRAARGSESGAAMVEFAFSAAAFFVFMIVTFEAGIIGWRSVTAQYIASQTVREAAMFAGNEGGNSRLCFRRTPANVRAIIEFSRSLANNMGLEAVDQCSWRDNNIQICGLSATQPFLVDQGSCKSVHPEGVFAGPEDFIAVRIVLPTRFLLQTIDIDVVGWAAARNEEFDS